MFIILTRNTLTSPFEIIYCFCQQNHVNIKRATIHSLESAEVHPLRVLVPYVHRALRALLPLMPSALCSLVLFYVLSCLSCLMLYVLRAHTPYVPDVPRALRALVSHMLCTLHILVPNVPRTSF